jgi:hypothetical protein
LNAFALAFNLGWLGHWSLETHEPERLKKQHHVDELVQISASAAMTAAEPVPEKKLKSSLVWKSGIFLRPRHRR